MGVWDIYANRISLQGGTKHDAVLKRETRTVKTKVKDNLSYHTVTIDDVAQDVAIINSDNLDEKTIISLPGEDIGHGGLVHWMDNYWLITERDANTTVYTRAKMIQCNHLLKWVSDDNVIHEQWCVIEDGTKLRDYVVYNIVHSLAYRKRYVIITPLIAGNPLEPYKLQHGVETYASVNA